MAAPGLEKVVLYDGVGQPWFAAAAVSDYLTRWLPVARASCPWPTGWKPVPPRPLQRSREPSPGAFHQPPCLQEAPLARLKRRAAAHQEALASILAPLCDAEVANNGPKLRGIVILSILRPLRGGARMETRPHSAENRPSINLAPLVGAEGRKIGAGATKPPRTNGVKSSPVA